MAEEISSEASCHCVSHCSCEQTGAHAGLGVLLSGVGGMLQGMHGVLSVHLR